MRSSRYAHLAVRAESGRVQQALTARSGGETAYVGPTEDRWCGVVSDPAKDLPALAAGLSDELGVPVLCTSVAPDGLELRLYVFADEIVRYRSADRDAARLPAGVERLIDATSARALPADVARILSTDEREPSERYAAFAEALGLPGYLVGAGGDREPPPGFVAVAGGAGP